MTQTILIPVDNLLGNYTQRVNLDNAAYLMGLRWNDAMKRWILDLMDSAGAVLLQGIPVLEEVDLLGRFQGVVPGLPPGHLVAIDGSGQQLDPDSSSFGVSVQLIYVPAGV